MRYALGILLLLAVAGCGGDDPAGPGDEPLNLSGEWDGSWVIGSGVPHHQANLSILQSGDTSLSGVLTLEATLDGDLDPVAPRQAAMTGTVSGSMSDGQVSMTFEFTDGCAGFAEAEGTIVRESDGTSFHPRIAGTYDVLDCSGAYSGTFAFSPGD